MRTLIGVAGLAILIGAAAPALADPSGDPSGDTSKSDGTFLASLKKDGVAYKNAPVAISVGKKACELIDQGHPKSQIIESLAADNPGFSADSATKFTTSAVAAYCPQHVADPDNPPAASPTAPPAAAPTTPPAQPAQPIIDFPVITPPAS